MSRSEGLIGFDDGLRNVGDYFLCVASRKEKNSAMQNVWADEFVTCCRVQLRDSLLGCEERRECLRIHSGPYLSIRVYLLIIA